MPPMVLFDKIINFQVNGLLVFSYVMLKQGENLKGMVFANIAGELAKELCYPHPKGQKPKPWW